MGNMLYNGAELPDINTVWTDKETYPYACIVYVAGGGAELGVPGADLASLQLFEVRGSVVDGSLFVEGHFWYRGYSWTNSQEIVDVYAAAGITGQVNTWFLIEDYNESDTFFAVPTWSSYDILNADGSVYLAATDPVDPNAPTPTYDRTAFLSGMAMGLCGKGNPAFEASDTFTKGYLVGAALRRKRVIVETDVLIDSLPIQWNSAEVTNNTKVTFGGVPFVRISNLYADDEGDVRTNAGSLLVTMGGMTITAPLVSVTAYNDNTIFMAGYNVNGENIYALSIGADNVTFNGTTFPKKGVYVPDVYVIYGEAICEFKSAIENAHSYNGYILPGLPEWDKTAYPYAFIGVAGGSNNAGYVYHLHVSDNPFYGQLSDGLTLPNMPNGGTFKLCGVYEEGVSEDVLESIQTLYGYTPQSVYDGWSAWTAEKSSTVSTTLLAAPVWANHDLVYYSGNLAGKTWVEASEPVPV